MDCILSCGKQSVLKITQKIITQQMPGLIQEHTQPSAAAAGDDRGEWFFVSLPLTAGALKSR